MYRLTSVTVVLVCCLIGCSTSETSKTVQSSQLFEQFENESNEVLIDTSSVDVELAETDGESQLSSDDTLDTENDLISTDNYEAILTEVFGLMNFDVIDEFFINSLIDLTTLRTGVSSVDGVTDPDSGLTVIEDPTSDWGFFKVYSCDANGSIQQFYPNDRRSTDVGTEFKFCSLLDGTYSGFSRYRPFTLSTSSEQHILDKYRIDKILGDGMEISGVYNSSASIDGSFVLAGWDDLSFIGVTNGSFVRVRYYSSKYTMSRNSPGQSKDYNRVASFMYSSPLTRGKPLLVSSDLWANSLDASTDDSTGGLVATLGWNVGQISVSDASGNRLTVSPVDGSHEIWSIKINDQFIAQLDRGTNYQIKCFGVGRYSDDEHADLCRY